jgi:hypothetical protein
LNGGYMIWAMYPEYKVFIDSRGGAYLTGRVWDDYHRFMANPSRENSQKMTAQYPFRVALINLVYAETILDILDNAGDEWRLLFLGKNAAILVHTSILSSLSEDLLRSINRDPANFREVKNPETLSKLFLIYVHWGSEYGSVIRDIYKQNVSNFYRYKEQQLAVMTEIIDEKRAMEKGARAF